ncbi:helix-turn-helix domain-containing protein [Pseudonocardia sp. CA-107938]|uniref:ArsR/SmtB family transcription factor n=1 Tax=Pseudonocardia sp. CA-107938 TaxID=3240021 RepID=UPI003D949FE2
MAVTEYVLDERDMTEVRFAVSPLNELALSVRTWRDPGRFPQHLPWLQRTSAQRAELDGELLLALSNDHFWLPDFLTPRPATPLPRIEDELRRVAAVEPEVVQAQLHAVHPQLPPVLNGPAEQVRDRIVAAVSAYWRSCFAPWWPRMQAILQADIAFRAHRIAAGGMADMFAGLSDRCALVGNVVTIENRPPFPGFRRATARDGLTLLPSLFTRVLTAPIDAGLPPMVVYPARGTGLLWTTESPPAAAAVIGVLGRTRAGLMALLAQPASSTELAVRLGVTTTAVNQHLRALRAAGLLTSARTGRHVLYARSELGDRLVGDA